MSCFILSHDSIRRIAHTLADILNASTNGSECTIATNAAHVSDISRTFAHHYKPRNGYNAEGIAADLYHLNVSAYNGRYYDNKCPVMLPRMNHACTLYTLPHYSNGTEIPHEWHYHLAKLLDCYLYQTDEDATRTDPLRKSLQAFSDALMREIVRHTRAYDLHKWGE